MAKKVKLVNLTPHTVNLIHRDQVAPDETFNVPPSGTVARVAMQSRCIDTLILGEYGEAAVRLMVVSPGPVEGLPAPEPGVLYIVSRVVLSASPDRDDLVVPDELQRDEKGRVIAAGALSQ